MDMKLYKVLKAPHITEQSSQLSQDLKQIVFKVDKGANKREIKKAVENLFNVTVVKVTTSVVKGKTKRNRFGVYKRSDIGAVDAILIDDNLKVYGGADLRREHHSSTTE
jgi:large subunit ribosomal protein L23